MQGWRLSNRTKLELAVAAAKLDSIAEDFMVFRRISIFAMIVALVATAAYPCNGSSVFPDSLGPDAVGFSLINDQGKIARKNFLKEYVSILQPAVTISLTEVRNASLQSLSLMINSK